MPALVPVKTPQFGTADAMYAHYTAVAKRLGKASAEAKPVIVLAAPVPARQRRRSRNTRAAGGKGVPNWHPIP
jgi:hypothetical protein